MKCSKRKTTDTSTNRLTRFGAAAMLGASLAVSGCTEQESGGASLFSLTISVLVTSDPGRAVEGAELVMTDRSIATTDATGHAKATFEGAEGEKIELAIRCPSGFESPTERLTIAFRPVAPGSPPPKFESRCAPTMRTVVAGIRAENGVDLPVLYLGREVARTDASGAAHVVLRVRPSEQVSLVLDTKSGRDKKPRLRPENPTVVFVAQDRDDFVSLEQRFETEKSPVVRAVVPARTGPIRIN